MPSKYFTRASDRPVEARVPSPSHRTGWPRFRKVPRIGEMGREQAASRWSRGHSHPTIRVHNSKYTGHETLPGPSTRHTSSRDHSHPTLMNPFLSISLILGPVERCLRGNGFSYLLSGLYLRLLRFVPKETYSSIINRLTYITIQYCVE